MDEQDDGPMPTDARLVSLILSSMGIQSYTERVPLQLLDFAYRYTLQTLQDAQIYAEHADRNTLNVEDIKLAIQARVNHSFRGPAPKDFLLELAQERNKRPLPAVNEAYGVRMPRDHALVAPDWSTLAEIPADEKAKSDANGDVNMES